MKDFYLHIEYVNGSEERFSLSHHHVVRDYSTDGARVRSVRVLNKNHSDRRIARYQKDRGMLLHQTTKG